MFSVNKMLKSGHLYNNVTYVLYYETIVILDSFI